MSDDKLRPEVRDALRELRIITACTCFPDYVNRGLVDPTCLHESRLEVEKVSDELHRLTSENAELRAKLNTRNCPQD